MGDKVIMQHPIKRELKPVALASQGGYVFQFQAWALPRPLINPKF